LRDICFSSKNAWETDGVPRRALRYLNQSFSLIILFFSEIVYKIRPAFGGISAKGRALCIARSSSDRYDKTQFDF
jgi:hypothetical protein